MFAKKFDERMASFRIIASHLERMEMTGYADVVIRVTHNRRLAYIPTGIRVTEGQLRKGEVADPHILSVLNARIVRFSQYIVDISDMLPYMTVNDVRDAVLQREAEENRPRIAGRKGIDLFRFWEDEYLKIPKAAATRDLYRTSLNRLRECTGKAELYTGDITLRFLLDYEAYMVRSGIGPRGQNLYMTHLKCVFNRAKDFYNDEDGRTVLIPNNPFAKYKIPAAPPAKKEGDLSKEQLLAIIDYRPATSREELARDCFVMSLFLAGMNSADLYYVEQLSAEWVLTYERTKTKTRRGDRARQLITVPEYLRPMFRKYSDKTKERVLNLHIRYADHKMFNQALNRGLKSIGDAVGIPRLYFYQARHSFATIARNELGFSLEDVGKCLTHVSANPVTDVYVRPDYAVVDRINKAVLEWVLQIDSRP